jgi:DNA-binding NtrC family response regulator/tetratricopeptide (TPR) repeat protein
MPDVPATVSSLIEEGRFRDALLALQRRHPRWSTASEAAVRIVGLELLERTGTPSEVDAALKTVVPLPLLSAADLARVAIVEGLVANCRGHIERAEHQFREACQLAESSGSLETLCWAQLHLLGVALDVCPHDWIHTLRYSLRQNIERAGSPSLSIAYHVSMVEHEGRLEQLSSARYHEGVAESLLGRYPNVWLSGRLHLQRSALSYLAGDFALTVQHAHEALEASAQSGYRKTRLSALNNLASAYLSLGQPARAQDCLSQAMADALPEERVFGSLLDLMAQSALNARDVVGCEVALARLESMAADFDRRGTAWEEGWLLRTRARLLQRRGRWQECLTLLRDAQRRGDGSSPDTFLRHLEILALSRVGHVSDATRALFSGFSRPAGDVPLTGGLAQAAVAAVLLAMGSSELAIPQYARALRILARTGESGGMSDTVDQLVEVLQRGEAAATHHTPTTRAVPPRRPTYVTCHLDKATTLIGQLGSGIAEFAAFIGSAADLAAEPEALGEEALRTLSALRWMVRGRVERISPEGKKAVVNSIGVGPASRDAGHDGADLRVTLGTRSGDEFALRIVPRPDAEAVMGCVATVRILQALARRGAAANDQPDQDEPPQAVELINGTPALFASASMRSLVAAARRIAPQNITVLLTGESGTGKEVVANLIHQAAGPPGRPFVVFNCATVPTDMLESQLFGYRRGAFTGAVESFGGVIRSAEGGTLFLDEIADLPLAAQPKLLRFLDAHEVQPLGEAAPLYVHARIVAATNADLEQLVREGRFRADLFYRINVVHFRLPPLRERREEIRPLAESFLARITGELQKSGVRFSDEALEHLMLRPWRGNVRELYHEVERISAFIEPDTTIRPEDLDVGLVSRPQEPVFSAPPPLPAGPTLNVPLEGPLDEIIREVESAVLTRALEAANGNVEDAAKRLGISRKGLYLKRRRLGFLQADE